MFPNSITGVIAGTFLVTTGAVLRWPSYVHIRNQYLPESSRSTAISLLSIFDSLLDLIILGSLGFIAGITTEIVLQIILVISLFAVLIGHGHHEKSKENEPV